MTSKGRSPRPRSASRYNPYPTSSSFENEFYNKNGEYNHHAQEQHGKRLRIVLTLRHLWPFVVLPFYYWRQHDHYHPILFYLLLFHGEFAQASTPADFPPHSRARSEPDADACPRCPLSRICAARRVVQGINARARQLVRRCACICAKLTGVGNVLPAASI